MEAILEQREIENKRKGRIGAGVMLAALIILLIVPIFFYQNPPPGQEGILVNLGLPDIGQGDDQAAPAAPSQEQEEATPPPQPEQPEPTPPDPEPEVDPEPAKKPTVTTEDPNAVALRKQKEKEARERAEQERREREQEARERAEREARERAEQERREREAAADNLKNELGGLFDGGSGKGNTGKPGSQGDPNGDPNASNLEGISTGSGRVGGGLGNRGVLASPSVSENSQKSGKVVIYLCVNSDGSVISNSVRFTQAGSTTSDSKLKAAALRNAKRWRFSKGTIDKQCGTITYNFRVQ